jgi:hypothetical protein
MTMCRKFNGAKVTRITVAHPDEVLALVDGLLRQFPGHPSRGCRSEFIRLAVAEKIGRELMLSRRSSSPSIGG